VAENTNFEVIFNSNNMFGGCERWL